MRETIFRGKRIDNGEWVHGFVHIIDTLGNGYTGIAIQIQNGNSRPFSVQVDESTIGEHTGLMDKNGKNVFEADIIKLRGRTYHEVVYARQGFWLSKRVPLWALSVEIEVIGNIYEHAKLLGDSN